jgi:hypothetical protein
MLLFLFIIVIANWNYKAHAYQDLRNTFPAECTQGATVTAAIPLDSLDQAVSFQWFHITYDATGTQNISTINYDVTSTTTINGDPVMFFQYHPPYVGNMIIFATQAALPSPLF